VYLAEWDDAECDRCKDRLTGSGRGERGVNMARPKWNLN